MMDKYSHICSMVLEYLAPAPRSIWDRNMKICIKTLVESAGMQPFRAFYGSVQRKFGSKLGWGVGDSVLLMQSLGFPCFERNWMSLAKSIILARQNALYIDLRKNLWTEVTKTKSTSFPLYQILGFVSPHSKRHIAFPTGRVRYN